MIEWFPLNLDDLIVISEQIDDVCVLLDDLATQYEEAPSQSLEAEIAYLKKEAKSRAEELQDFYFEHDADDRAILFQKQRLKLRKALLRAEMPMIDASNTAGSTAGPASSQAAEPVSNTHDDTASFHLSADEQDIGGDGGSAGDISQLSSIHAIDESMGGGRGHESEQMTHDDGHGMHTARSTTSRTSRSSISQPAPTKASMIRERVSHAKVRESKDRKSHTSKVKPIYSWERRVSADDDGTGAGAMDDGKPSVPRHGHVTVKLTPEEFEILQARISASGGPGLAVGPPSPTKSARPRRTGGKTGKPKPKSGVVPYDGKVVYLNSSTPFIEPERLRKIEEIKKKKKWVAPGKNFNSSGKLGKGVRADPTYLNSGVLYVGQSTLEKSLRDKSKQKQVTHSDFNQYSRTLRADTIDSAYSFGGLS